MSNYLKEGFIDEAKRALQSIGDKNVIESIKVNGVDQDVDNRKAVNIKIPTKNSELENDIGYLTQHQDLTDYAKTKDVTKQVTEEISKIVAGAPDDFDTLKEMSDWIYQHDNSAAAMNSSILQNKEDISTLKTDKADADFVTELNSNLDTLEYSDVAGGKNLIDVKKVILGDIVEGNVASGNNYITDFIHLEYGKKYIISNCYKTAHETAWFTQNKTFVQRTFGTEITPPTNDCYYARIEYGVEQGINAQLEEGTQATEYEPYIPSVKMLAEENAQQATEAIDLKMLGWTVPKECPIQNYTDSDGVFHQRVGRVDLGSLEWTYDTLWKATSGVSTIKNLTVNMYHSVYVPTIANVSDIPTNSVKKADSGTLWINNGSSTEKPSGYLYFELATEKTIKVDGNEAVTKVNDSLSVIGKCKNLLNPIFQTTTMNGVTCTNNGDGTYTLNGTVATGNYEQFTLLSNKISAGTYKLVGNPDYSLGCSLYFSDHGGKEIDYGNGGIVNFASDITTTNLYLYIPSGVTLTNVVFKPMLTTNLNATYDDFVPYTGDGETLTHDVAKLNENLGAYDINENATSSYSKNNGFAIEWLKMCKATKGMYKLSYTINGSTGCSSEIALGKSINDKTLYRNIGLISDGIYEQIIDITSDTDIYIMAYTNGSITISNIKFTLQNIANEVGNLKNDLTAYVNGTKAVAKATTADSATKSTQDGNGNNIAETYATKDEIPEPVDTSTFALKEKYGDTTINIGRKSGTTVGSYSIAEGYSTTASGNYGSHAEGNDTTASGYSSHSEGNRTTASGAYSHAEGFGTTASGKYSSHAEGYNTTALNNQHAQGHYNNTNTANSNGSTGTSTGTAFVIGNGTSGSSSNAFRITGEGMIYATNATVQTGADYAEYFEWSDGNPKNEDRVGYFVTFDENDPEKIRYANNDDYILGIVSGMPNVIGNGDEDWKKRYILDDFGRYIVEEFEYEEVVDIDEETGEKITETKIGTKWKENPDYDNSKPYVQRKERPEWDAIGMLGVLSVYDDGTCKVNGYCRCGKNGIATSSNSGYRVIARITNDVVKVVFR